VIFFLPAAAGVQLFQGDIVVDSDIRQYLTSRGLVLPGLGSGRTKRAVMRNERSRWIINGKGVVPYFIESSNRKFSLHVYNVYDYSFIRSFNHSFIHSFRFINCSFVCSINQ